MNATGHVLSAFARMCVVTILLWSAAGPRVALADDAARLFVDSRAVQESLAALYDRLARQTEELQQALAEATLRRDLFQRADVDAEQLATAVKNLPALQQAKSAWEGRGRTEKALEVERQVRLAQVIVDAGAVAPQEERAILATAAVREMQELQDRIMNVAAEINKERQALLRTARLYQADFDTAVVRFARPATDVAGRRAQPAATAIFPEAVVWYAWNDAESNAVAGAKVSYPASLPPRPINSPVLPGGHVVEFAEGGDCRIRAGHFRIDFVTTDPAWGGGQAGTGLVARLLDLEALSGLDLSRPSPGLREAEDAP